MPQQLLVSSRAHLPNSLIRVFRRSRSMPMYKIQYKILFAKMISESINKMLLTTTVLLSLYRKILPYKAVPELQLFNFTFNSPGLSCF